MRIANLWYYFQMSWCEALALIGLVLVVHDLLF